MPDNKPPVAAPPTTLPPIFPNLPTVFAVFAVPPIPFKFFRDFPVALYTSLPPLYHIYFPLFVILSFAVFGTFLGLTGTLFGLPNKPPPPLVGFVAVLNTLLPAPPERPLINLPTPFDTAKAATPKFIAVTPPSINPSSLLLSPTCSTIPLAFSPILLLSIAAAFVFSYCFLVPCITSSHPRSVVAISLISSLSDWVCCFIISKSVLDNDFSARLTSCFLPLLSTYETVALPFCTVAIFLSNSCSSSV